MSVLKKVTEIQKQLTKISSDNSVISVSILRLTAGLFLVFFYCNEHDSYHTPFHRGKT